MYDDNLFAVDTTNVEKMGGFEVYPSGIYNAMMIAASKKPTKNNDGAFIECVYQFMDGDYIGKKFTSRMNLWNSNSQAVDIAKRELKSLRAALGLSDQTSSLVEFVNKPLKLNITAKARKDDASKAENNLVSIDPYDGAPSSVHAAPVASPAPQYQPGPILQQYQQQPIMQSALPPQQPMFAAQPQPLAQPRPVQPAPPAFQPNGAATPPWVQGAR